MIKTQRHKHVAESLRDSENRGMVAVSFSESLTYVKNTQPRRVPATLSAAWPRDVCGRVRRLQI